MLRPVIEEWWEAQTGLLAREYVLLQVIDLAEARIAQQITETGTHDGCGRTQSEICP